MRAIGLVGVAPGNRLRAMISWGGGAPPLTADTCIFAAVHLHRSALVSELEAAGFTIASEITQGAPDELPAGGTPAPAQPQQPRERRHGPKPGETGFNAADSALFPAIEKILKSGEARSRVAAARILVNNRKVAGDGTPENRAVRLARHFGKWKSSTQPKG